MTDTTNCLTRIPTIPWERMPRTPRAFCCCSALCVTSTDEWVCMSERENHRQETCVFTEYLMLRIVWAWRFPNVCISVWSHSPLTNTATWSLPVPRVFVTSQIIVVFTFSSTFRTVSLFSATSTESGIKPELLSGNIKITLAKFFLFCNTVLLQDLGQRSLKKVQYVSLVESNRWTILTGKSSLITTRQETDELC